MLKNDCSRLGVLRVLGVNFFEETISFGISSQSPEIMDIQIELCSSPLNTFPSSSWNSCTISCWVTLPNLIFRNPGKILLLRFSSRLSLSCCFIWKFPHLISALTRSASLMLRHSIFRNSRMLSELTFSQSCEARASFVSTSKIYNCKRTIWQYLNRFHTKIKCIVSPICIHQVPLGCQSFCIGQRRQRFQKTWFAWKIQQVRPSVFRFAFRQQICRVWHQKLWFWSLLLDRIHI